MRKYHYWLVTRDENGKPYLIYGSPNSEEEARQKGLEMLPMYDFEIKRFPTSDLGKASAMLKGRKLEELHDLHQATRRLGHDKSLKRLRRKHRIRQQEVFG